MRLNQCHNFHDFRAMARQRCGPIFNYIDGAADDEPPARNTAAFEDCDLVPNVLRGVADVDLSVTVMGQKLALPVCARPRPCSACSITMASAPCRRRRPARHLFGVSSLGTVSLEEARRIGGGPRSTSSISTRTGA